MSFERLDRAGLFKATKFFGIETNPKDKNDDLREKLLQHPTADWPEFRDELDREQEEIRNAPIVGQEEPVEADKEKAKEIAKDEDAPEDVLVRFLGKNRVFQTGRYKFHRDNPYAVVSKGDLHDLVKRELVRIATEEEVQNFYN